MLLPMLRLSIGASAASITCDLFLLSGGCPTSQACMDVVYSPLGTTRAGTRHYESGGQEKCYVYHDPDCNGKGEAPRWILDDHAPSESVAHDLDEDDACSYYARIDSGASAALPTSTNTWTAWCEGETWESAPITLTCLPPPPPSPSQGSYSYGAFSLFGAVGDYSYVDGDGAASSVFGG